MSGFENQGLLAGDSPGEPASPASPQRPRVKKTAKESEALPGDEAPQRNLKYKPEDYAQAVQEKIEEAVDLQAKYRHAGLYTLFVIAYLLVLYLQASAYKSGEVVRTLKQVMMPKDEDGNLMSSTTFKDQHAVLGHLWHNILEPTWKDPVCGDQKCEYPWEFPSYGRFGCRADCGQHQNLTKILVLIQHDFTGHPTANPRVLMSAAKWNLCQNDPARRARGEADLCWYADDNGFETVKGNVLETAEVIDGTWYVQVTGDYAGRISGAIYDLKNASDPKALDVTPAWEKCEIPKVTRRSTLETSTVVRRMMNEWTSKREDRRRRLNEGELTQEDVDAADHEMIMELQGKVDQMKEQAQKLEEMEAKIQSMMSRMKNKTPAQKRLESRFHVQTSERTLVDGYNAEMRKMAAMSPEELAARAEAIGASTAGAMAA
mmetsp:Transcript_1040/g.2576  ORF Transcript_1040/g.2576 Transcript_1040/m.2576 type:complete len:432 (+) Transcript_1040:429-1724(+)